MTESKLLLEYEFSIEHAMETVRYLRQEMFEMEPHSVSWNLQKREIDAIMEEVMLAKERVKELA